MKKTLLSAALLMAIGASAQSVNNFYPLTTPTATYYLLTAEGPFDQSTAGENVTWNYPAFQPTNDISYTDVTEATTGEVAEYPGTTSVVTTTVDSEIASQFFLANSDNGGVALTGASSSGVILNYSTNNFNLGTFPKSFSTSAVTDDVAGTFSTGTYEGTFTGTGTTSVDATGTFNVVINDIEVVMPVVRLKIEQNLNLMYMGLPMGTLTQVMYSYYADEPVDLPAFRTLTATLSIPAFNITETQESIETYYLPVMGIQNPEAAYVMCIAPNPVGNKLHVDGAQITGLTVTDNMGRVVLTSAKNDADISGLSAGVYYVAVAVGNRVSSLKMVKQ